MKEKLLTMAGVTNNDYCGTVAADYEANANGIDEYLEQLGFQLSNYLPYSIKLRLNEPISGQCKSINLIVHSVKRSEVGNNLDDIELYLRDNEDKLNVYKFVYGVTLDDYFNKFKRFEIDLAYFSTKLFTYTNTIVENIVS